MPTRCIVSVCQMSVLLRLILLGVGTILLVANLQESALVKENGVVVPDSYHPVIRYLFTRGWPLSPWMFSLYHGGRLHPEEPVIWWSFVFDALLALNILICIVVLSRFLSLTWKLTFFRKWLSSKV
jgi:hypothetical protein